jgi:nucleoside-diphosphate-sugar epimerase
MKVLIAGGTGALGIPIVEQLIEAGHSVTGLTRTRLGAEHLEQLGATAVIADALECDALLRAVDGLEADAVVHQMTALKKAPLRQRDLEVTNRLRIAGTRYLVEAARVLGARRFVTQSIVFGYGYRDHGDTVLTEDSPFGETDGRPFDDAVAAMASTEQQAFDADGIDGIALRYGLLYGGDAAAVERMLRRRSLPVAAHGGQLAFVHHRDAAAATVAALERGRAGEAYNIVDDEPATFRELINAIAEARDAPKPLALPAGLLQLVAPYGGYVLARVSMRVSNAKAKRELGWVPRYPSYREGVAALQQA